MWAALLPLAVAQEIGALVDFSLAFPERLNEERVMNVVEGDFVLEAELDLDTNFEDIDRVVAGTLGHICQYSQFERAPVSTERFLDMASLSQRRKAFRYKWWLLPLQNHPLPGDCMSSLAQFGYGAPAPPYDDRLPPPIRNLFAIELSNYESTASLDSTAWGLALRNVSCTPHNVRLAVVDGASASTTTPLPTHVCDGRLYATGVDVDRGFEPTQVSDCGLGQDPCLCLTLRDCEWQPGRGDIPGGCAATANPGVTCEACPFQPQCEEPPQRDLCALARNGCDCAMTRKTSAGNGCVWITGVCISRSTPDSPVTSCDSCPSQVRCGTPQLLTIAPNVGYSMGEQGLWLIKVLFDREIYTEFREDDTGMTLRCDAWEPAGGSTYRISASMLTVSGRLLTIDLKQVVSTKRKSCALSMARSVLKAVDTDLPYPGLNDGSYFVYLPDTERPTVLKYTPPNSARGLGLEVEVTVEFSEPVFWGPVPAARRVEIYQTGDAANQGQLLETILFTDDRVQMGTEEFKVLVSGLETTKFYSILLPPFSLSDREGNNFTGLPRNHYIFGTGTDTTVDAIDWTGSLFIVLGITIVGGLVVIGFVAGYLVMHPSSRSAQIFARQARSKGKVSNQADPLQVEDVDDGFYAQKPLEAPKEGLDSRVTVAWAESSTGIEHMAGAAPQPVTQVQVVTPRNESPAPEEGFGSRSGSQVATLVQAHRIGSKQKTLPEKARFTPRESGPSRSPSHRASDRAPRAPGPGSPTKGPQLPSEPSPELAGLQLQRGASKMSLSGSFKGPLSSTPTMAESAAVSRSMSKKLNGRPQSRGLQTPVRPSQIRS